MPLLRSFLGGLRALFSKDRQNLELDEELRDYLATATQHKMRSGMSYADALRASRVEMGSMETVKENVRTSGWESALESLWQDMRYGIRQLLKSPGFSTAAILTLALGIGGNTAIFTLVRAVLLKPLDYRAPGELVYLSLDNPRQIINKQSVTVLRYEETRRAATSFSDVGAFLWSSESMILSGVDPPEALRGARVSANFLEILGVKPSLGRSFLAEEDKPAARPVAMISSGLWKRRFGADPQVAGRLAEVDATPYTIVGVLPESFTFPFPGVDVWVTRPSESSALPSRFWRFVTTLVVFGRLKPGITLEAAKSELEVLNQRYMSDNPGRTDAIPGTVIRIRPLKERIVSNVRPMLWLLFGAVGLVLLIACANIAGLVLARAASRSHEFAIRAALGAKRGRLIQQLLVESSILALIGGALGGLLAVWFVNILPFLGAPALPRAEAIQVDGVVLAFNAAVALGTGILFGLFPALEVSRPHLSDALRVTGPMGSRSSTGWRLLIAGFNGRELLVVGQVALSIVLLVGAGLLIQSVARLRTVDLGFRPDHLLTMKLSLPNVRYETREKRVAFYAELERNVKAQPGTSHVALMRSIPTDPAIFTNVNIVGRAAVSEREQPSAQLQSVTPDYFAVLGIAVRRGRPLAARDNSLGAPPAIVINETFARTFWPGYPAGPDPVGQRMGEGADRIASAEIVGVVADVHEAGVDAPTAAEFYVPMAVHAPRISYLAVRTVGPPQAVVSTVRKQVLAVDPDQPISEVRTMNEILDATLGQRRLAMLLLVVFSAIAVLLASIGLYGVMAYNVELRTPEIGLRRALGADPMHIVKLIIKRAVGLTLMGIAIGVAVALALTRTMQAFVFEISPSDHATIAGVSIGFAVVAIVSSSIPVWRAVRVDPMTALRS